MGAGDGRKGLRYELASQLKRGLDERRKGSHPVLLSQREGASNTGWGLRNGETMGRFPGVHSPPPSTRENHLAVAAFPSNLT